MGLAPCNFDHGALECANKRQGSGLCRRTRRHRSVESPPPYQPGAAANQALRDTCEVARNRVVLSGKFQSKSGCEACDVASAKDGMGLCECEEFVCGAQAGLDASRCLAAPRFVDPRQGCADEGLLVPKLVIDGSARIPGIPRYLIKVETSVPALG